MKARIKREILFLSLSEHDIDEDDHLYVDRDHLEKFCVGDDVEILKEIEVGQFAECEKSYVVYNPKNHYSTTLAGWFLEIE